MRQFLNRATWGLLAFLALSLAVSGQTGKQPAAASAAIAPGSSPPDLSGVWTIAPARRSQGLHGLAETLPPELDEADNFTYRHSPYPLQPWALEKFNYNRDPENPYYQGRDELNPTINKCSPQGPTVDWQFIMFPFEIIQTPKRLLIIFERDHEVRQIWTDGRSHPKDFGHNWMGHSIGHWEGDTLVADTLGLNDLTWLDKAGHVHSDQLHLIERLQLVPPDKLVLSITFDDPKAFAIPWSARKTFQRKPGWELEEEILCEDKLLGKPLP